MNSKNYTKIRLEQEKKIECYISKRERLRYEDQ